MSKSLKGLVVLVALGTINYDHDLHREGKTFAVRAKDADQLLEVKAAREATEEEIAAFLEDAESDDAGTADTTASGAGAAGTVATGAAGNNDPGAARSSGAATSTASGKGSAKPAAKTAARTK